MIELERSRVFSEWLDSLKDIIGKGRIISRLRAAEHGNFGDYGFVGDTVYEMRVHYGPGYRMSFTRRDEVIYLLLIGAINRHNGVISSAPYKWHIASVMRSKS